MATFTRSNAWNSGGDFSNSDLLWYAKAVGVMQSRALNDSSSWWFFAAIHGEYIQQNGFPGWSALPGPPAVPTAPVPGSSIATQFWDQCQHQSWYFLPWHRGYLLAIEAQIRAAVINLGGPATWALPYWNYFGPATQYNIPPAFTQQNLPDGTPNPLFVTARYGPDGDGNIYIPTAVAAALHPGDPNFANGLVTQDAMSNDIYTGSDAVTPPPGFGGPQTGFNHGQGTSGNLENDPHNLVHVYVGGNAPDGQTYGLMSDPGIAALDPIFYLHHANIDRMWAVWNLTNGNPPDASWLNGPAVNGNQEFVMPMPGGNTMVYTPQQMNSLAQMNYTYDNLPQAAPAAPSNLVAVVSARLASLGATAAAAKVREGAAVTTGKNRELVGATQEALPIKAAGAKTSVKLDTGVRRKISASLAKPTESSLPDRVFLNLENVRGTHDSAALSVYINLPDGAKPGDHPELLAGTVGLFGLRRASLAEGQHAGQGLNFVLDITKIVDQLHLKNALDVDSLKVTLVPRRLLPDQAQISVGRISIYRQGQ